MGKIIKRKKKKILGIFPGREVLKWKKFSFLEIMKELYLKNPYFGVQPKNAEVISTNKKNSIKDLFFSNTGVTVHAEVTIDQLRSFMARLEKDLKKFKEWDKEKKKPIRVCLRHISPDLTFIVRYK